MAGGNLFIGATGVQVAGRIKEFANFHQVRESPRVFAVDIDFPVPDLTRVLGHHLVVVRHGFYNRLRALGHVRESFEDLRGPVGDRVHSFGDPTLKAGAEVVATCAEGGGANGGLRGAGWLALRDLSERDPTLVKSIAPTLEEEEPRATPVLRVIASVVDSQKLGTT